MEINKNELARKYLGTYQFLLAKRQATAERLLELRRQIESANSTSIIVMVKGSHESQSEFGKKYLNDFINDLIELEQKYLYLIKTSEKKREELEAYIKALLDGNELTVIYLKYCEGFTFEKIAVTIHYSYRQVIRFYHRALDIIQKDLEKNKMSYNVS